MTIKETPRLKPRRDSLKKDFFKSMPERCDLLLIKTHAVRFTWVPLGLMYVAKAAENTGAKVKIIDLSLEKDYRQALVSALQPQRDTTSLPRA